MSLLCLGMQVIDGDKWGVSVGGAKKPRHVDTWRPNSVSTVHININESKIMQRDMPLFETNSA